MAPSEETTATSCSQQEQGAAGSKIQQERNINSEESIGHSAASNCVDNTVVDDSEKNSVTCHEKDLNLIIESQSSKAVAGSDKLDILTNSPVVESTDTTKNTDSTVDSLSNTVTTCGGSVVSSPSTVLVSNVMDAPRVGTTVIGNVGRNANCSKSVGGINKGNRDQILDGAKQFANNCVDNDDQVAGNEESVVDSTKKPMEPLKHSDSVAGRTEASLDCRSNLLSDVVENVDSVTCRPKKNCLVAGDITSSFEIVDCCSRFPKRKADVNSEDGSCEKLSTKVDNIRAAEEGGSVCEENDHIGNGDEDVREKCVILLKELVSRADEVNQQRQGDAKEGSLWCRLPFSKVSRALQSYKSSTNSALIHNKWSNKQQYTSCDKQSTNLMLGQTRVCKVNEMSASCNTKSLNASLPNNFTEESSAPSVFQGHETTTAEPSLPTTPDEISADLVSAETAVAPYTPSSTQQLGSPSTAISDPDLILSNLSLCPRTPDHCSSSLKDNGCDLPYPVARDDQKLQHSSTVVSCLTPQRFLFQVEPVHQMKLSDGQKLFACDICSGVYQRCFSLKRHYLRAHINHRYLTERDISNCGIVVSDRVAKENPFRSSVEKKITAIDTEISAACRSSDNLNAAMDVSNSCTDSESSSLTSTAESNMVFPYLYRCHFCSVCFNTKDELRDHLSTHKPVTTVSKEKIVSKSVRDSRKVRSKSLPNLKKRSKGEEKSSNTSPLEIPAETEDSSVREQLSSELDVKPENQEQKFSSVLKPTLLDHKSKVTMPIQSTVHKHKAKSMVPTLKTSLSCSSKSVVPNQSSKCTKMNHSSSSKKLQDFSEPLETSLQPLTSDHSSNSSSKSVTSNQSSAAKKLNHSSKPLTLNHSSKCTDTDHSTESETSHHSLKLNKTSHSTNLFSKTSSPEHLSKPPLSNLSLTPSSSECSSKSAVFDLNTSSIKQLSHSTTLDKILSPIISSKFPTTVKPSVNDRSLKCTSISERGQLLCLYCDKSFSTPTMHKRHVSRSHPQQSHAQLFSQNKTLNHKCAYCTKSGDTFRELPLLVQHLVATHPDLYHACTSCELRFDSKRSLVDHLNAVYHSNHQFNAVPKASTSTVNPLLTLTSSATCSVTPSSSSHSTPELKSEDKPGPPGVDVLGGGAEFLYSCSVCRQVFNDYVAMCRHHRRVHKGKRTLNSLVGSINCPTTGTDSRNQSSFMMLEKELHNQIQDEKCVSSLSNEKTMVLGTQCKKAVDYNVEKQSGSEEKTDIVHLSSCHDLEKKNSATTSVMDRCHTSVPNKTLEVVEPKDTVGKTVDNSSDNTLNDIPSISVEKQVCNSSDCIQDSVLSDNAEKGNNISNSVKECVLNSSDDNLSSKNNSDLINRCSSPPVDVSDSSAAGNDSSTVESADLLNVESEISTQSNRRISESVLNRENYILKTDTIPSLENDASDLVASADLIASDTSVSVESTSESSLFQLDSVSEAVRNSPLSFEHCISKNIGSKGDDSESSVAGKLSPSETIVTDISNIQLENFTISLPHISNTVEAKSESVLLGSSDSLKTSSDSLEQKNMQCVGESSELLFAGIASESKEQCSRPTQILATDSASDSSEIKNVTNILDTEDLAGTVQPSTKGSESSIPGTTAVMDEKCELLLDTTTNSRDIEPDETSETLPGNSSHESSHSVEQTSKSLLDKSSDPLTLVDTISEEVLIDEASDSVMTSLNNISESSKTDSENSPVVDVISTFLEPSLGEPSNSLVTETSEILEETSDLLVADKRNGINKITDVLDNDTDTMKESCSSSPLNPTQQSSKLTSDDTVHSKENCKHSLVDTTDNLKEDSESLLSGTLNSADKNTTPILFGISESTELHSEQELIETRVSKESSDISLDDVPLSEEENSQHSLVATSNTVEESSDSLSVMKTFELSLTESLDFVEESFNTLGKEPQPIIRSLEKDSVSLITESNIASTSNIDYMQENSKSTSEQSLQSLEERFNHSCLDSVEDISESSTDISVLKEENCISTSCSDLTEKHSENIVTETLGTSVESSKSLLSDIVNSVESKCKLLTQSTSDSHSDLLSETSDSVVIKSKPRLTVVNDGGEVVSGRVLRSSSASLTKNSDSTDVNNAVLQNEHLLRSKNDTPANDQVLGSDRVLRSSSTTSVLKPLDSVTDANDHTKGENDRILRSSAVPKSDESVDQEAVCDTDSGSLKADSGSLKARSKVSTAIVTRGTRLRKFSRRVRGEQTQEEQRLDPETLFYCRIAGNIQENLLHHLDGKLEHEVLPPTSRDGNKVGILQSNTASSTNQDEKHHHLHHHRVPWEKFNFPKNYDGRCGEGTVCLASYIKDMSHLDISTQLMMRQNLQRLSAATFTSRMPVGLSADGVKDDIVCFSRGLNLNAKVSAEKPRRRSLRSAANRGRESLNAVPGGAASTFTASAALKRWSSADDVASCDAMVELSGEWVRPRSYVCAACGIMFNDLWDLEDHKYNQHPNVWCTHYEFEQAALEQSTDNSSKSQGGSMSSKDLCRRFLLVRDVVETALLPTISSEVKCTKCEKGFSMLPELHRHILECGGDTTWMLLPSPSSTGRRARKWRPFGSRRRRQQGSHRRGMKRNIPATPVKQYFRARQRTAGGDSDSIQRMLANLPAKRSTRRVIQFSEDEIKTRSQGTMHSVSFTSGVLRTSHMMGNKLTQSLQLRAASAELNDSTTKKLTIRSLKKLSSSTSTVATAVSEQTSTSKRQLVLKKLPRSKSQPESLSVQSNSARSDVQKKSVRGGRSLSPVVNKLESLPSSCPIAETAETKQPVLHKGRNRTKKQPISSVASGDGQIEPKEDGEKNRDQQNTCLQEFDVDITAVGSSETSNILAAMRIAMLEGVITETPSAGTGTKKLVKRLSVKKHPCTQENKLVFPGKRKKMSTTGQQSSIKKKTKLSQSDLEERFLRNKGYIHPDDTTDEPIICKGCGLQFDSGSAELRHRKTCIYLSLEKEVDSSDVGQLHPCPHCSVQFPSEAAILKHTQLCKVTELSSTEVNSKPSLTPKKTANGKARTKPASISTGAAIDGKTHKVINMKKIVTNVENMSEISNKTKKGIVISRKKVVKTRNVSDTPIKRRNKVEFVDRINKGLNKQKKQLNNAETSCGTTIKKKISNMEATNASPVEIQKNPEDTCITVKTTKKFNSVQNVDVSPVQKNSTIEHDNSNSVRVKKKLGCNENASTPSVRRRKKSKCLTNKMSSSLESKEQFCRQELASSSPIVTETNVDSSGNLNSSDTTAELANSSDRDNSASAEIQNKLNNATDVISNPGIKKKKPSKAGGSVVTNSPVGAKKKVNRKSGSPVETKSRFGETQNEVKVIEHHLNTEKSSNVLIQTEKNPDSTEVDNNNTMKTKKRSNVGETIITNPTKGKKIYNRKAGVLSNGTKRKFGNLKNVGSMTNRTMRKSTNSGSLSSKTSETKSGFSTVENNICSPANSDIDDRMPELQKEEPIENLKTETPSPKVGEDLCDIPILSPVGCELLPEDCEEKKSEFGVDNVPKENPVNVTQVDMETQDNVEKQPKILIRKNSGMKKVVPTLKVNKSSKFLKNQDDVTIAQSQSKIQEASVTYVEPSSEVNGTDHVILHEEIDNDDKPLAETLVLFASSGCCKETSALSAVINEDEITKVDNELLSLAPSTCGRTVSPSKKQKRNYVRHKNSIPMCEKKPKKVANKVLHSSLSDEDSNDDLLPISKLKEVIQKKIVPLQEIDFETSESDGLNEQKNILVVSDSSEVGSLIQEKCSSSKEPNESLEPIPSIERCSLLSWRFQQKSTSRVSENSVQENSLTVDEANRSENIIRQNFQMPKKQIESLEITSTVERSPTTPRRARVRQEKNIDNQSSDQFTRNVSLEEPLFYESSSLVYDYKKIPKRKSKKYTEKITTQKAREFSYCQMKDSLLGLGNEEVVNVINERQETENNKLLFVNKKTKMHSKKIQSQEDSIVLNKELNTSVVDEKLSLSTSLGKEKEVVSDGPIVNRKVKRLVKTVGSQITDQMHSIDKGRETNHVDDATPIGISLIGEPSLCEEVESGKMNSVNCKNVVIPKRKTKKQIQKIKLQETYSESIESTIMATYEREPNHCVTEIQGSDSTYIDKQYKRTDFDKRKSKRILDIIGSQIDDVKQHSETLLTENEINIREVDEQNNACDLVDDQGPFRTTSVFAERDKQTEETVVPFEEEASVHEVNHLTGMSKKKIESSESVGHAPHLNDNKERVVVKNKRENFISKHRKDRKRVSQIFIKKRGPRQKTKVKLGKKGKLISSVEEEHLISEIEEKCTVNGGENNEKERNLRNKNTVDCYVTGDKTETDKSFEESNTCASNIERDLQFLIKKIETNISVDDSERENNFICTENGMNVLACGMEEITGASGDVFVNHSVSEIECSQEEMSNEFGENEKDFSNTTGTKVVHQSAVVNEITSDLIVQNKKIDLVDGKNAKSVKESTTMSNESDRTSNDVPNVFISEREVAVDISSAVVEDRICQEADKACVVAQEANIISVIVEADINDQMDTSSSTTNKTEMKILQKSVESPLRQARRTRCNTSYEEVYTWSDVTSETEDSSQDLPDTNIIPVLCQNTDPTAYEEMATMIVNGEHLFPSVNKKKKKKKLRNNSRQYRNGQLRKRRRKKQKFRTKLVKKTKKPVQSEFIVTDIETGLEESQDSCESNVAADVLKSETQQEWQAINTDTNTKFIKKKAKKARKSIEDSENQTTSSDNLKNFDDNKPKMKRKSSVGSMFFCTLCNKHYSTNYNLMKHKLSLTHRRLSETVEPSTSVDVKNAECEQSCPNDQTVQSEDIVSCATENDLSKQPSCPINENVDTEQVCSSADQITEDDQTLMKVGQNVNCEEINLPEIQSTEAEKPSTATDQNVCVEKSNSVEQEDEQLPIVMGKETGLPPTQVTTSIIDKSTAVKTSTEHITTSDDTAQNLASGSIQKGTNDVESSDVNENATSAGGRCQQTTAWRENQTNVLNDWLEKENDNDNDLQQKTNLINWPPCSEQQKQSGWYGGQVDNNQWLYTGQWTQEMAWNRGTNPDMNWNADSSQDDGTFFQSNSASLGSILDSVNQILDNERSTDTVSAADGYQPYVDLLHSSTGDADPTGGLRELQQAMGATDEEMAMLQQLGEDNWPLEDADIMDLDNQKSGNAAHTNAAVSTTTTSTTTTTTTTTTTVTSTSVSTTVTSVPTTTTVTTTSSISSPTAAVVSRTLKTIELSSSEKSGRRQEGSAASSSVMAHTMSLSRNITSRSGLRTQDMQLARYENKDMVCPVCSRRFLGLSALRAHLAAAHNSSTRHRTQAVIKRPRLVSNSQSDGSEELTRFVCLVCKELLPDEQGLADHVGVAHLERQNPTAKLHDQRPDGLSSVHNAGGNGSSGGGDEGLRSHMTSALGGLLTRALNNFLGKNRSQPSSPITQSPSSPAESSNRNQSNTLVVQPMARLLSRGLKTTSRRHSSGPVDEQPFHCVDCDVRFSSESNRNRHIARAHRGPQHRRLSTDSPRPSSGIDHTQKSPRTTSPLISSDNTLSETDTDSAPLSTRISSKITISQDNEPCRFKLQLHRSLSSTSQGEKCSNKSLLTVANAAEVSTELKGEHSNSKHSLNQKRERCDANIVQEGDVLKETRSHSTADTSSVNREHEKTTASKISINPERRQEKEDVFTKHTNDSRTGWRNGMKGELSRSKLCNANDEDSIKAKAVAALRALNARDRRIRNGLPGTIGAAMWSGVSRKKSRGYNSDDRFRFPLVRKTPPSVNRFASLVEKKKKNVSNTIKYETKSHSKVSPDEGRQETPNLSPSAAIPISYDVYEFQDEVEQVQPLAEFGLRAPVEKVVSQEAEAEPSSDVEESSKSKWESLLGKRDMEETKKPLKHLSRPKHDHSNRKHQNVKKKRWHRIIVDSGDDTSDTEMVVEPCDTHRTALDQRLDNHRTKEKSMAPERRGEEGRSMKRRHVVPCVSGVLVEDRQCGKQTKTLKQPSKSGSRRSTKTDLLMCVFAKSRQRSISNAALAKKHSVAPKPPFSSTSLSGSYQSLGTYSKVAGDESESDSGSLATSGSAGNLAMSSDEERTVKGKKSQSKKRKRGQKKTAAL